MIRPTVCNCGHNLVDRSQHSSSMVCGRKYSLTVSILGRETPLDSDTKCRIKWAMKPRMRVD